MYIGEAFPTQCILYKMHASYHTKTTIHHDTNAMQMQEMHKGKLYICYKGAPTHPTQEIKQTPSSPRKRVKVA